MLRKRYRKHTNICYLLMGESCCVWQDKHKIYKKGGTYNEEAYKEGQPEEQNVPLHVR